MSHACFENCCNIDRLDGTGPTRHVYDVTQGNIFQIYGSGSYCTILFNIVVIDDEGNQVKQTIHKFTSVTGYSMTNPNLPISVRLSNPKEEAQSYSPITARVIERQYSLIGQFMRFISRNSSAHRLGFSVAKGAGHVPLLSLRRKSDYMGDPIRISSIDLNVPHDCLYQLRMLRPGVEGSLSTDASFGCLPDTVQTETMLEQDVSATSVTGGVVLFSGLAHASSKGGVYTKDFELYSLDEDEVMVLCVNAYVHDIDGTEVPSAVVRCMEDW